MSERPPLAAPSPAPVAPAIVGTMSMHERPRRLPARIPSLDAVRAVLSLAVLVYHLGGTIALPKYFDVHAFATLFAVGDARIPFFFVLSGFLLTLLHGGDTGRPDRLGSFLWRRAVRIYPAYWLVLLVVVLAALLLPGYGSHVPADPVVLVKAALLVPQTPDVAGPTGAPLIVAAWTLHYEIAFYAVVAAFIANRALGIAIVLVLAWNHLTCADGGCGFYRSFLASQYAVHFAIGACAAWLSGRLAPRRGARRLAALAIGVYLVLVALQHAVPDFGDRVGWNAAYALTAGAVLLTLVLAESGNPPRRTPRWISELSRSSYSLYLVHFPLISAGCKVCYSVGLRGVGGATVAFGLIALACVTVAWAFHRIVERPVVEWLNARFTAPRHAPRASVP